MLRRQRIRVLASAVATLVAAGLAACRPAAALDTSGVGRTDGAGSGTDEGESLSPTPDKPSSISGAYLTGFLPKIQPSDTQICFGVQVRNKDGRLSADDVKQLSFQHRPPKSASKKLQIKYTDLSSGSKAYYFHGIYCMPLPDASGGAAARKDAIAYFLNSAPRVSSPTDGAKAAGLALAALPSGAQLTGEAFGAPAFATPPDALKPALNGATPAMMGAALQLPQPPPGAFMPVYFPPANNPNLFGWQPPMGAPTFAAPVLEPPAPTQPVGCTPGVNCPGDAAPAPSQTFEEPAYEPAEPMYDPNEVYAYPEGEGEAPF
jgi:hypothetical protein